MNEGVVLLHGILRTSQCMRGLSLFLKKENYKVLNLEYPSSKYDILSIAKLIRPQIQDFADQVTNFLQSFAIYKTLYGPAGQQLITDQTEFKDIFGSINYELIAGSSPFYYIANKIIGKESDGRVSIINTKIEGMKEHIIINSGHTMLASNKKAWQLTLSFLNTGTF